MLPANKIQNLTNALNTMRTKLLAAFASPVNEAGEADNAQKLNGLTIAQMKQQVQNRLNDHLGTNSHGLTAEMLGTYQKGDINVKVNNLLARADLPMSLFRATAIRLVNKNQIFIDGVVICLSGLTFSQTTGFSFTVPTLLTNSTYYLTASLSAGSVVFGVTQSPVPENEVNMWIATFTVNSSNNQTIPFSPIVRYGAIRGPGNGGGSTFIATTKDVDEELDAFYYRIETTDTINSSTPATGAGFCKVGNLFLVIGGVGQGSLLRKISILNTDTLRWDHYPDSFFGKNHAAYTIDGMVYCFSGEYFVGRGGLYRLGFTGTTLSVNHVIDVPGTNNLFSYGVAVDEVNRKVYYLGGCAIGSIPVNNLRILDLATMSWSEGTPYPFGISNMNLVFKDGKLYCFGGLSPARVSDLTNVKSDVYVYDIQTAVWTLETNIPRPLHDATVFVDGDDIVLVSGAGGEDAPDRLIKNEFIYAYNTVTKSWRVQQNPNIGARIVGTVFKHGNSFYVWGGSIDIHGFDNAGSLGKLTRA